MFWILFIVMCAGTAWLLRRIRRLFALVLVAGAAGILPPAGAQHAIDWYSIDNGGGRAVGPGGRVVQGTLGQPDAQALSAGEIVLVGGLWGGGPPDTLFADGFESPPGLLIRMEESDEYRNE